MSRRKAREDHPKIWELQMIGHSFVTKGGTADSFSASANMYCGKMGDVGMQDFDATLIKGELSLGKTADKNEQATASAEEALRNLWVSWRVVLGNCWRALVEGGLERGGSQLVQVVDVIDGKCPQTGDFHGEGDCCQNVN
ncbi:hypothetical protein EDB89DRAFT_1913716 [Lactarius sanguifluus]|nr:hypothetical protein EDB89DRAFT_1913716 [Lactarius sanguifluus]